MRNIVFYTAILSMILILGGCSQLVRIAYGVRQPRNENISDLIAFRNRNFGKSIPFMLTKKGYLEHDEVLPVPELYVFDKKGRAIDYRSAENPSCSGPASVFLSNLVPGGEYRLINGEKLQEFCTRFQSPESGEDFHPDTSGCDFFVFVTWARWTGSRIYHQKTKDWISAVQSNRSANIHLMLINEDYHDF